MKLFQYILVSLACTSCTLNVSFNGGKVPDGAETIQIDYFPAASTAPLASGLTSQNFTEALRDVFLAQTKLSMVSQEGDLHFMGEIKNYTIVPINISASSETAAQNRLTVGVEVQYFMNQDSLVFKRNFQRFADYDSNKDFASIEEELFFLLRQIIVTRFLYLF